MGRAEGLWVTYALLPEIVVITASTGTLLKHDSAPRLHIVSGKKNHQTKSFPQGTAFLLDNSEWLTLIHAQ